MRLTPFRSPFRIGDQDSDMGALRDTGQVFCPTGFRQSGIKFVYQTRMALTYVRATVIDGGEVSFRVPLIHC